ncbi:MAG: RHS repeat-associated core domain-containing protein [Acidobacteriia bacterium]|nr:RHS repeat-associated core domain-containing protein [Terriglobia bacterium]
MGSYTDDNNGNTLADASGKNYAWDFENRLASTTVPGTGLVTFRYDPFGRRVQKSGPNGTTNYLYDGDNLLEEVDNSGNVLARYTQGSEFDEELSELRSGTTSYYQADGLGSITSLSNSGGALANTYSYDFFGKLTASSGTLANPFQYTGRESDSEAGLYYYRNRYYDQNVGRFVSEDPMRFEAGSDFYSYVSNSPVNLVDPFGLQGTGVAPAPIKPVPPDTGTGIGAFCAANPVVCEIVLLPLYLASPGLAGDPREEERCRRKGRWHCTAKCPIKNFSFLPNIPDYVFGEGWGNSKGDAELAAEKDANTKVPRGTHKQHCTFKCEKR